MAPCEEEALLGDVHALNEGAVKALVDDAYLGYVGLPALGAALDHFHREAQPALGALRNSRWMCALTLD